VRRAGGRPDDEEEFMKTDAKGAHPGDRVEVHQIGGGSPRVGVILEVLGQPGHEHYRVRWDEKHESIHFPSDGTRIVPARARR
jgi:hypothetical protein